MNLPRSLFLLSLPAAIAVGAPATDVPTVQRREPIVAKAEQLSAPPRSSELPADLKNPFAMGPSAPAPSRPDAAPTVAVVTDRDLLEKLAPHVSPTGMVQLGGEPILLFGQKRARIGDPLPITFEGNSYVLVITAIQGTSFTLRLNGEELTRPIKPANRP